MGYLLIFTREDGQTTNRSLSVNVTEVSLSSQDGLEDNHRYFYIVTAFNSVGTVATTDNAGTRFFGKVNHNIATKLVSLIERPE